LAHLRAAAAARPCAPPAPVAPLDPGAPGVLAAHFAKVVWLLSLNALLCQRPEFSGCFVWTLGGL